MKNSQFFLIMAVLWLNISVAAETGSVIDLVSLVASVVNGLVWGYFVWTRD